MPHNPTASSPRWGNTTKLVVGLTFVAIVAVLLISFRGILAPLLLSFILAYLFSPLAEKLRLKLKISWRLAVSLIYLVILIILAGLLTWGGIALIEQIQSLLRFLQRTVAGLPTTLDQIELPEFQIGPFVFGLGNLDLTYLVNQLLGVIQPLLSQAGTLVGSFASSAAITIGLGLFVILISFFILSETEGIPSQLINIQIPGYQKDLKRMGEELGRIWNSFLRGQLIIIGLTILVYTVLLGILGVRFFYGLAILAGLARFVPYVGPAVAWTVYGLVSLFQGQTLFGLPPFWYAILVIACAWVTDVIMDNLVVPRVLSDVLRVHPAAVMVAALIAASWLGIIGVMLAAPVLATLKLFSTYATRKMFDMDPWEGIKAAPPPRTTPQLDLSALSGFVQRIPRQKKTDDGPDDGGEESNPPL